MMKIRIISLMVLITLFLSACGNNGANSSAQSSELPQSDLAASGSDDTVSNEVNESGSNAIISIPQTGQTEAVPEEYMIPIQNQGIVQQITYNSKDYAGNGGSIQKTAYVYLPCGYDQNDTQTKYNIFYLMHGWGGRAGEYFDIGNGRIKNMLDRMIDTGEIPPMIIVSATFYNDNSSSDFGSSVRELRVFHEDFTENLMPAVEGQFHTFAESTSKEDLIAARDHRAFGGFSLGAVTTWMEFCYDADYIRWFLPMSGACWYYGGYGDYHPVETSDFFEELIAEKDLNERGYFIYVATGTNDSQRGQVDIQMEEMLKRKGVFTPEHVVYYLKDGGQHDFNAVQEYIYNALPLFFK